MLFEDVKFYKIRLSNHVSKRIKYEFPTDSRRAHSFTASTNEVIPIGVFAVTPYGRP